MEHKPYGPYETYFKRPLDILYALAALIVFGWLSDCGIGMLKAMGDDWKKIRQECSFVLASDVTNPLCG